MERQQQLLAAYQQVYSLSSATVIHVIFYLVKKFLLELLF